MSNVAIKQNNKLHPHKFILWVAIGSILMMFAGLTSAYVVKRNQANWVTFELPLMFWYSTAVILASSVTLYLSAKAFKEKAMSKYRSLMTATLALGVLFIALQIIGFNQLWNTGATLQSNVSYSFPYVIVGIHAVHVLGGVITLLVMSLEAFSRKSRNYSAIPVELISTYWHFVDFLWLYLLVFLLMIR